MINITIDYLESLTNNQKFVVRDTGKDVTCPICRNNIRDWNIINQDILMYCEKCFILFGQGCSLEHDKSAYRFNTIFITKYKYNGEDFEGSPSFTSFQDLKDVMPKLHIDEIKCTCKDPDCEDD